MFRFLPPSLALSKGADLWIVTPPEQSFLSQKIEWHTGFLFRRMKSTDREDSKNLQDPLLIEASSHLPCTNILFLHFENSEKWLKQGFSHWKNLKNPSLRLFLPKEMNQEEITNNWPFTPLPYRIQVILEKNSTKNHDRK